ncbi:MAG: hypothetical protein ACHQF2_10295 [Flavobacteriales bacterium]
MHFPQYRKLSGGHKFYHILSNTEWEETYFIGNKPVTAKHVATQLPERNFLLDLLEFREGNVEAISETEYNEAINR